jgi:poly(3-hydroxybutyrate) depolymerase
MKIKTAARWISLGSIAWFRWIGTAVAQTMSPDPTMVASSDPRCTNRAPGEFAWRIGDRQYLMHVPESCPKGVRCTAVLDVHGFTSSPEEQRMISGILEISDAAKLVVAYPRGIANSFDSEGSAVAL